MFSSVVSNVLTERIGSVCVKGDTGKRVDNDDYNCDVIIKGMEKKLYVDEREKF